MGIARFTLTLDSEDWEWFKKEGEAIYPTGLGGGSAMLRKVMAEYRAKVEKKAAPKSTAVVKAEDVAGYMPLKGGKQWPLTHTYLQELTDIYPGVNVGAELNAMVGWLDANPAKRKTAAGMKRFITSWLSRAKDKGGSPQAQNWAEGIGDML